MRADIIDAEVVEDFNVDEVFEPQVVHEVEVYAGPDDTAARTNLRQAGEIEKSSRWTIARLIAASVGRSKPGPKSSVPWGTKLGGELARLVKTKQIRKVSKGVYEPADRRTVGEVAEIEVRRDVKPVVPDAPKVELKPCQNNRTVSLLLEVIARSDDPKPYAGVVREIGDLLATS